MLLMRLIRVQELGDSIDSTAFYRITQMHLHTQTNDAPDLHVQYTHIAWQKPTQSIRHRMRSNAHLFLLKQ